MGSVEKIKNHSIFVEATLAVVLWNRILKRADARPVPIFVFFNTPLAIASDYTSCIYI